MSMTERTYILRPEPTDVSMVRDPGMQALIILARSLGWNMMHKPNQPVVITARNGTQKRIPTNTSIRISVFQTTLASILLHSEEMTATIELVDQIIRLTKVDQDHARRLRAAMHEDEGVLADRVMNSGKEEVVDDPGKEGNYDKASYLAALQPTELLDRKPTTEDFDAWVAQLESLPWITGVSRNGTIVAVDTEMGERQYWCAFPGCRQPWNYDANSIRGHVKTHSVVWGPISDSEHAIKRAARTAKRAADLKAQGFELDSQGHILNKPKGVRTNAAAIAAMAGGPVPDVIATEAAKQAEPKLTKAAKRIDEAYSPGNRAGTELLNQFTEDALLLLEVSNRFVATLDEITSYLQIDREGRIAELEAEIVRLKEKADRYDLMREAFRDGT